MFRSAHTKSEKEERKKIRHFFSSLYVHCRRGIITSQCVTGASNWWLGIERREKNILNGKRDTWVAAERNGGDKNIESFFALDGVCTNWLNVVVRPLNSELAWYFDGLHWATCSHLISSAAISISIEQPYRMLKEIFCSLCRDFFMAPGRPADRSSSTTFFARSILAVTAVEGFKRPKWSRFYVREKSSEFNFKL